ncbi:MAG: lipoyl(octanoyl) transferase LipB [Betaproteobacteria bacterium]|nr:lipoyl(octanoyl) transferase LipB [Betaproteobacteria bacterium]
MITPTPLIKHLGLADYLPVWQAMQAHNRARTAETADEFWIVEHPPTFTLGLAGKPEHLINPGDIPVIPIDRGGQVTYHGPGQLVVYPLLDLRRLTAAGRIAGVKALVHQLEQAIINLLQDYRIEGHRRPGMPGVYTADGAKIAAIGLRVARHACYHGLSLNVDMDLTPFNRINPCGYPGLAVTQMRDLTDALPTIDTIPQLGGQLLAHLLPLLYGVHHG